MSGRRSDRRGYEKMNYDLHVARVKGAKGSVDCLPPRPHPLANRSETDQKRRHAAIEHDNILLLERLASSIQFKTIDNEQDDQAIIHASFKREMLKNKKRIELQKITSENQRILRRIQEVPPAYNHTVWEEHAKKNERQKKRMSLYPEYYDKLEKELVLTKDARDGLSPNTGRLSPDFNVLAAPPSRGRSAFKSASQPNSRSSSIPNSQANSAHNSRRNSAYNSASNSLDVMELGPGSGPGSAPAQGAWVGGNIVTGLGSVGTGLGGSGSRFGVNTATGFGGFGTADFTLGFKSGPHLGASSGPVSGSHLGSTKGSHSGSGRASPTSKSPMDIRIDSRSESREGFLPSLSPMKSFNKNA